MTSNNPIQFDRRTALKWVLAAAAALQMPESIADEIAKTVAAKGYGKDPDLLKAYTPGQLWPLTLGAAQRRTVATLSDTILPAEGEFPAASKLGVVEFIDEWISAPYPQMSADREQILEGLTSLEEEAQRRFKKPFTDLTARQIASICDDLASVQAKQGFERPTAFFQRFKQLVAAGYYTTPQGMKDIGYVGNVPLAKYEGPPKEVLERIGVKMV